jgi:uncharacterized protein
MLRRLILALALCCSAQAFAQPPVAVPALQARVTDLSGTLDAAQRQALEQKLAAFEQEKGSQVAVLMLPTTAPETIEQYAIRVAEQWKLGRKGVDDGVLLLVATQDRALRIEVGYGLEGAIPDAMAKRVIEEVMLPRFRDGDMATGIDAGVDSLLGLIRGEPLPEPPAAAQAGDDPLAKIVPLLFGALFVGQFLRALLGPLLAAVLVGGGLAAVVMLVSGLWIAALFSGLVGFALVLMGMATGGGGHRSSGGGFGGGGFRGGGGGFGGGGASGRW